MTSRHDRHPRAARRFAAALVRAMAGALLAAVLATTAFAAGASSPSATAKKVSRSGARVPAPARDRRKAAPPADKGAVRTLDAIRIEGEIAVPQVLFITARDFRRFRDGVGVTYQPSALDVARGVALPVRLRVVASHEMTKEEGK